MLKAGSLYYAVLIALLVALISSSLILYAYYHQVENQMYDRRDRLVLNAHSGLNILIGSAAEATQQEYTFDLYGDGIDSVTLKRQPWGLFEVVSSQAMHQGKRYQKVAQLGYAFDSTNQTALYLTDLNRPLSLCGKTIIRGDCKLPEAGVKRAYIEGQSFSGNHLIQGKIGRSGRQMPTMDQALTQSLTEWLRNQGDDRDFFVLDYDNLPTPLILTNSFLDSTILIHSFGNVVFDRANLKGNIMVVSNQRIIIGPDAHLEDVLCFAPEIEVEDGFVGNVQLFARDSLFIGEKVHLQFPSVAALFKTTEAVKFPYLSIGADTKVEGVVWAWQQQASRELAKVSIASNATVMGQVIVDGMLELQGTVLGNVTCRKFSLRTPSSVYENHLLNATIDFHQLSKHYVSSALHPQEHKKVVKWLQ